MNLKNNRHFQFLFLCLLYFVLFVPSINADNPPDLEHFSVELPGNVITNIQFKLTIDPGTTLEEPYIYIDNVLQRDLKIKADGNNYIVESLILTSAGKHVFTVKIGNETKELEVLCLPGILTLLPPVIAILLALLFRQVIIALVTGVWLGASILAGYNPLLGLFDTITNYIKNSVTDPDRASILLFTTLLGGMIGVISKNGGTLGVVKSLKKFAKNPRRSQLATWFMGLFIFFDDYSNTLIVGNTMRPITDKLYVSREKLAYIVDSTAAPVTSIAVVTTWVGFQISLIATSFQNLGIEYSPFITFIESVPFQFYSILAIFFVFLIISSGRDFGPMLKAERRARTEKKVLADEALPMADLNPEILTPPENIPYRWYNALFPILYVIIGTLAGLVIDGSQKLKASGVTLSGNFLTNLKEIFSSADSFKILLIVSFTGCIVAIVISLAQKLLSLAQSMEALVAGLKSMLMAVIILILAGAIGDICSDLGTADYISSVLRGGLPIYWLPVATFLTAAFISFSTGTSWGTMSILTPLVIPLSFKMAHSLGMPFDESFRILLITIASIMGGAVFGDHSSPISDTTIMSSIASASDHIHHVKTQIPYAAITALFAAIVCLIPTSIWGLSPAILLPLSFILMAILIRLLGKKE
ncbi:MAG: Na+/H+ antiporter NhaC family protein [Acidobacteria bacterium]|nr:Na+/H+ antiporter NhaC family protein [Acidobacteriota bacterium]